MKISDYVLKRGLPECYESEKAVLSILVKSNEIMEHLVERSVEDDYFHSPMMQSIFKECKSLLNMSYNLDPHAVFDRLRNKYNAEQLKEIVRELWESAILTTDLSFHIDNLILHFNKRKCIENGINLIDKGYNGKLLEDFITEKTLPEQIKKYIQETTGDFNIINLDKELKIMSTEQKKHRTVIMCRLAKEEFIEKIGKRTGNYRLIIKDENVINWQNADIDNTYNIVLPFGIHNLINLYAKNIIVVAGVPDAGKTAFLLNILHDNMDNHEIFYFSSEMGEQEFKVRLSKFKDCESWNFTAIERSHDFVDVIRPDDLNIIDFFEMHDNFFDIGAQFTKIHNKLNKGICVIAIQKKKDAEYGRGAEFSLEKARLYLSMDSGVLKIIKAKNWKDPAINPNNKVYDFKLIGGCEFIQTNLVTNSKTWEQQYK